MKRLCIAFLLLVGPIVGFTATPKLRTQGGGEIHVSIDGNMLAFKGHPPLVRAGRVLVPMRDLFEGLGAVVQWTPKTKLIVATKGNETVELRIGQKTAMKNGAEIVIETPPIVLKRSTMVPLRFVAESLRASVTWDDATNTVVIVTGDEPPAP